jgi:hypothetical protein
VLEFYLVAPKSFFVHYGKSTTKMAELEREGALMRVIFIRVVFFMNSLYHFCFVRVNLFHDGHTCLGVRFNANVEERFTVGGYT